AVAREDQGVDLPAVARQGRLLLPRGGGPELDDVIRAARGQGLAVGAEGYRQWRVRVPSQHRTVLPACHVPEDDRLGREVRQTTSVRPDALGRAGGGGPGGTGRGEGQGRG